MMMMMMMMMMMIDCFCGMVDWWKVLGQFLAGIIVRDSHHRKSPTCWDQDLSTAWKVPKCGVISGPYFSVFGLNTGKYGPETTPYLDTFHAMDPSQNLSSVYVEWSCAVRITNTSWCHNLIWNYFRVTNLKNSCEHYEILIGWYLMRHYKDYSNACSKFFHIKRNCDEN